MICECLKDESMKFNICNEILGVVTLAKLLLAYENGLSIYVFLIDVM